MSVVQRLATKRLFPAIGAAIHVNHPVHDGNVPPHDHDFLEITLIAAGHAVHRTAAGTEPIGPGHLFILHPGQWHVYEQCRGLRLYNCCIASETLAGELSWLMHDPRFAGLLPDPAKRTSANRAIITLRLPDDERLACAQEMAHIVHAQNAEDPCRSRAEIIARVLLILGILARCRTSVDVPLAAASGRQDPLVKRCVDLMEEALHHAWGLEELASLTGVMRFRLVRLFRRHIGCPPMQWLNRRRVEKAAVLLLTTNLPIAEIARQVGWNDANYFSRRFRSAFGQTPRDYRNKVPQPVHARESADWVQW